MNWFRRHEPPAPRPQPARTMEEVVAVRRPLLTTPLIDGEPAPYALKPLPALPAVQHGKIIALGTRADRELSRELVATLREIADLAAGGRLPRWLLVSLAPSVATAHHLVRHFLARQEGRATCAQCAITEAKANG
jgi:hypothetical protein